MRRPGLPDLQQFPALRVEFDDDRISQSRTWPAVEQDDPSGWTSDFFRSRHRSIHDPKIRVERRFPLQRAESDLGCKIIVEAICPSGRIICAPECNEENRADQQPEEVEKTETSS